MDVPEHSSNYRSPLIIIRQKELEISERLDAARQAAERTILEARHAATEARDQAERGGREAAVALLHSQLATADIEAENVRTQGESIATQIAERAAQRLDLAVQRILECVLPKLSGE